MKFVILGSLILMILVTLSCNSKDKITNPIVENSDEPKCEYKYFINDKHELDSSIVECPEVIPNFPQKFDPLNIDSLEVWNIG